MNPEGGETTGRHPALQSVAAVPSTSRIDITTSSRHERQRNAREDALRGMRSEARLTHQPRHQRPRSPTAGTVCSSLTICVVHRTTSVRASTIVLRAIVSPTTSTSADRRIHRLFAVTGSVRPVRIARSRCAVPSCSRVPAAWTSTSSTCTGASCARAGSPSWTRTTTPRAGSVCSSCWRTGSSWR